MRIKSKSIRSFFMNVFLVVLCMYVAQPFYLKPLDDLMKYSYYMLCLYPVLRFILSRNKGKQKKVYAYFILYILVYYLIVIILAQQGDNTYIVYLTRKLLRVLGMVAVAHIWKTLYNKGSTNCDFGMIYVWSVLLYIITTIYFILNPKAKVAYMDLIDVYMEDYIVNMDRYATRFGLAGWSSFGCSVWAVIGLVYLYYMYLNKTIGIKKFIICFALVIVGSAMYARSGIILSVFIIIIILLAEFRKRKIQFFNYMLVGVIAMFLVVLIIRERFPAAQASLDWMFEYAFAGNGSLRKGSTGELLEMYKNFKPSIKTLLIGDGRWNLDNGTYYGHVDVGILRNILFGGVVYTIFEYGIAVNFIKLIKTQFSRMSMNLMDSILVIIAVVFVFCELKGDMMFQIIEYLMPLIFCTRGNVKQLESHIYTKSKVGIIEHSLQ